MYCSNTTRYANKYDGGCVFNGPEACAILDKARMSRIHGSGAGYEDLIKTK